MTIQSDDRLMLAKHSSLGSEFDAAWPATQPQPSL